MIRTTVIARLSDGLHLAASMDDDESSGDIQEYKQVAKDLIKQIVRSHDEARCSVGSGSYVFHYLIEKNVIYLTLCDKTYPQRLAFSFLEELKIGFEEQHGADINSAGRPYAFVRFDTFIQKTKKQYQNSQTQRNMARLNEDLQDVHRIMTTNIQDVLGRQDALNKMSEQSGRLAMDSAKYLKGTRDLNLQLLYRKYGPPGIVIIIVLIVLYVRYYWPLTTAEKRANHNATERARRENLNYKFLELASHIPALSDVRKPSKSLIVQKALEYVQSFQRSVHAREDAMRSLITRNNELKKELDELKLSVGIQPQKDDSDVAGMLLMDDAIPRQSIAPGIVYPPTPQTPAMNSIPVATGPRQSELFNSGRGQSPTVIAAPLANRISIPAHPQIDFNSIIDPNIIKSCPSQFPNQPRIRTQSGGLMLFEPNRPALSFVDSNAHLHERRESIQSQHSTCYSDEQDEKNEFDFNDVIMEEDDILNEMIYLE